ncbi:MAG: hypothetical protein Q4C82_02540 [Eubacteriales bacterium]|nr:hypothetical protein [Eubacteriales bacterium]
MKRRKWIWAAVFLAAALSGLFFFRRTGGDPSGSGEEERRTYSRHYAMITGGEDSEFWDKVYESALEEGRESGVYVERFGSGLAVEYSRSELIDLAVQASVDGIIVPETRTRRRYVCWIRRWRAAFRWSRC